MFIVKATYGKETRRFSLAQTTFPSFDSLYAQLLRVLPSEKKYSLSKVVFIPGNESPQLVAQEVHSAEQFNKQTAHLANFTWPYAKLRFNVKNVRSPAEPQTPSSISSSERSYKSQVFSSKPPASSTTASDKQEIKQLMVKFLDDFGKIMSSTFGDNLDAAATATPTLTARPEVSTAPRQGPEQRPVHYHVTCDVCDRTIVGTRFKCLDCPNYDQCEECIETKSITHPNHRFCEIATPGNVVVHTIDERSTPSNMVHNASCDLCDSRIRGARYKCTNCPDFDVCENCYRITPQQHPTHIFAKLNDPRDIMPGIPEDHKLSHSARCNACNKMIYGYRYKCLMCHDFDLCMHCEALPISVHPDTHLLCKIKSDIITASHPLFQTLASFGEAAPEAAANETSYQPEYIQTSTFEPEPPKMPKISIMKTVSLERTVEKILPEVPKSPSMVESEDTAIAHMQAPAPVLKAAFVSDNNMPDGQLIAPGAEFVKGWSMKNDGNCAWPEGTSLVFIAGNRLAAFEDAPTRYKVDAVDVGDIVDVWAGDMKAPDEPGRYVSYWSLQDSEGCLFGHRVWCDIVVPELELETSAHSGSVTLPSMKTPEGTEARSVGQANLSQTPSEITDPVSLSTQSGLRSTSIDSREFEEWEETGSIPPGPGAEQGNPACTAPGTAEWILLDD